MLCVLLVPGAAYAISKTERKQYSATAKLLFRDPGLGQIVFGSNFLQPNTDPTREAATNTALVSVDVVSARTAQRLGNVSAATISRQVKANAEGQSNLVDVTATDGNAKRSAQLANTYAQQFVLFRQDADRSKVQQALSLVRSQLASLPADQRTGTEGRALASRVEQLQELSALQTGNAELVQPADVPGSPASPKPVRSALIGLILGLLLAAIVAALLERFDTRLRHVDEVEQLFDRPLLGMIPQSRALDQRRPGAEVQGQEREAFLLLRANLRYFNLGRELRSVLITSAAPGDGKSTVAKNLTSAVALTEGRALLIEADLRNPVLSKQFGVAPVTGLSAVLAGHVSLEQAVETVEIGWQPNSAGPSNVTADVLFAGPKPPNPTDLIESDAMRQLISHATERYDLVVIDTPPTAVVSDAIPLVNEVDGVVAVVRLGHGRRDAVAKLQRQLAHLDASLLGIVVNGAETQRGYGYGYYSYYGDQGQDGDGNAPSRKPWHRIRERV